jgi:subtilisin family serine protease
LGLGQLAQIKVPEVHDLGLHGEGVVIAVFDTGFDSTHEAFATTPILAARDFVNGDDDVRNGADQGDDEHGTATLSVLGAFQPGSLIGASFGSTFILAKTENTWSETPVEEDHWAAAAEWAEALGADVISSSLGYVLFDSGTGYAPTDMNGTVAVSTRAADLAAERGIVVVNSAGNAGFSPERNTLGAPADGFRVLAIAAVDPLGGRADFSSVGPSADGRIKPDLAAQGVGVRVARSLPFLRFGAGSGTSFACPLVAGAAALVLQAHPEYTVAQVHQALKSTASQAVAPDTLLGFGLVDALAAVTQALPEP